MSSSLRRMVSAIAWLGVVVPGVAQAQSASDASRACANAQKLELGENVFGQTTGSGAFTASCAEGARSGDAVYSLTVERRPPPCG